MFGKLLDRVLVGLLALTLVLAGPVALGLALTLGSPSAKVVQVSDALSPIQSNLLLYVQEATPEPDAAAGASDAVAVTPNQEVVIEWGNWVQTLLKPIKDAIYVILPMVALLILRQLPGWIQVFVPRQRVNDMLFSAAQSALASVEKAAQGKKLTVTVTNNVLRQMAIYMISTAPELVKITAENLPTLLQKALFALPQFATVDPAFSLEKAVKAVTEESVVKTAKGQGISPDPFNVYFGK